MDSFRVRQFRHRQVATGILAPVLTIFVMAAFSAWLACTRLPHIGRVGMGSLGLSFFYRRGIRNALI